MEIDSLKEIGLQEGEIKLYISLLKLNEATATEISKHSGMHRSHIYDLIEKLKEKGLVSFVIKNNVKYFRASDPGNILDYLDERKENIKKIMPELSKLRDITKETLSVEIYKGKEGIKTILNDILKEEKDYLLFGNLKFEKIMPLFIEQFVKRADKLKITERAILESGTKIIPTKRNEYKYISKEYLFPNAIVVYGNKVATFIWQDPFYIILSKSDEISQSHKSHFNTLWKIAKN